MQIANKRKASSFTDEHVCKLLQLLKLEYDMKLRDDYDGGFDMSVGNINYWFLETIPDLLQDLADETTTAPEGLTLSEWKATLERMVFLFREANVDTCSKFAGDSSSSNATREAYCDTCKTEALSLFSEYFWYLDA